MMELDDLAHWLDAVFRSFVMIDGRLFFLRKGVSIEEMIAKVRTYATVDMAQEWMNIVLLEDFIDAACGDDWSSSDTHAKLILDVISRSWSAQVRAEYPGVEFVISPAIDDEYGDFGLRLLSKPVRTSGR